MTPAGVRCQLDRIEHSGVRVERRELDGGAVEYFLTLEPCVERELAQIGGTLQLCDAATIPFLIAPFDAVQPIGPDRHGAGDEALMTVRRKVNTDGTVSYTITVPASDDRMLLDVAIDTGRTCGAFIYAAVPAALTATPPQPDERQY